MVVGARCHKTAQICGKQQFKLHRRVGIATLYVVVVAAQGLTSFHGCVGRQSLRNMQSFELMLQKLNSEHIPELAKAVS